MKEYIRLSIRTKIETTDIAVFRGFIESLGRDNGLLVPEFLSHNVDKIKHPFKEALAERLWASKASIRASGSLLDFYQDFAWQRKSAIKSAGDVVHTSRNMRGQVVPGSVHLKSEISDRVDWYGVFKSWCEIFSPQVGMLHAFCESEIEMYKKSDSFLIGSFNSALNPSIPNMGWAMFYGGDFSHDVDVSLLRNAGFFVDEMACGYLVRITEDIHDVVNDFSCFSKRRDEIKNLFDEDFFISKG